MSANGTGLNKLSAHIGRYDKGRIYTVHPHPLDAMAQGIQCRTWVRESTSIGSGTFGTVFRERHGVPGNVRAVKVIRKPSVPQYGTPLDYGRELAAIGLFSKKAYEPYFVKSHGWYDDAQYVYISMEYVQYGSLQSYIAHGLPEVEAKRIVWQILTGVAYMHQANYAHRDLKPLNLLVVERGPEWRVKIADFGLSKQAIDDETMFRTAAVGTPGYRAPEVLWLRDTDDDDDDDERLSYTNAVDIWSIGVILYVLLTGQLPFHESNNQLARFVKGKHAFPVEKLQARDVSILGQGFVRALLTADPRARPGAVACLQSAWMTAPPATSTTQVATQAAGSSSSSGQRSGEEDSALRPRESSNRRSDSQRTEVYRG